MPRNTQTSPSTRGGRLAASAVDRRTLLRATGVVAGTAAGMAVAAGAGPWRSSLPWARAAGTGGDAVQVPELQVALDAADGTLTPPFPADFVSLLTDRGSGLAVPDLVVTDAEGAGRILRGTPDCADADDDRGRSGSALARVAAATEIAAPAVASGHLLALGLTAGALTSIRVPALTQTPWTREALDHVLSVIGEGAYLSRARWGADESLRFDENGEDRWGSPPSYYPAQVLTVHHTATDNADPDPAATVRAIYRFHTIDRGFGDIGYQLLVDERGRLYEGRYSGEDILPGHDTNLLAVQGAHTGRRNSGNFGVALLGNFMAERPTGPALGTLVTVLAGLSAIHGLDPRVETTYRSPVIDFSTDIATVPGHRDWNATDCPGDLLYGQLPWLREQAARLMDEPSPRTLARIVREAVADGRARPGN